MKKNNIILGLMLILLSIVLHGVHYAIFKDLHHIMIYLVADIAFVPLEVFFVSLVLEQMMEKQEERKILKKMNMLVGLFYQQFGNDLLKTFVNSDENIDFSNDISLMDFSWSKKEYTKLKSFIKNHNHNIDVNKLELKQVHDLLKKNQSLMVNLISNPTLLEKEDFSDVLMSTFHLYEELEGRDLSNLDEDDLDHLSVDCKRVYEHLSLEWVFYIEHLQKAYPYLFWTAVTTNPYDSRKAELIDEELRIKKNQSKTY